MLFEAGSLVAFLAAASFSTSTLNTPSRLLATGAHGADLVRFASLLDMLGYLTAIPLALYLRHRFRDQPGIDFFTLAGILFMVLGALGAVMLAFAGAPLIREYGTSSTGRYATEKAFFPLSRLVFFALWQTLDGFLAAVWAFGVGRLAWQQRGRLLAGVLVAIGVISASFALVRVSGV